MEPHPSTADGNEKALQLVIGHNDRGDVGQRLQLE